MAKFWTADEHYGHKKIIEFCKRPFANIDEMREALIAAHNAKVKPGDLTYHVGDMFWRTLPIREAVDIMSRLNGQHAFIWGNHDELLEDYVGLRERFVKYGDILHLDKTATMPKVVLCHYAMRVWRGSHNGTFHLYGHSHAALPEANTLSFDCGVDGTSDFAPWSEAEIVAKMKAKKLAGAIDPMTKEIKDNPWNKAEGAEVLYPAPQISQEVWAALKESEKSIQEITGANRNLIERSEHS